jgi:hypothetical protein
MENLPACMSLISARYAITGKDDDWKEALKGNKPSKMISVARYRIRVLFCTIPFSLTLTEVPFSL